MITSTSSRALAAAAFTMASLGAQPTWQLHDVVPGPLGSSPGEWRAIGSSTVFTVTNQVTGLRGLWRTNGTPSGTRAITSSGVGWITPFGDRLLMVGPASSPATDLWSSDGRSPGLSLVFRFRDVTLDGAANLGEVVVFRAEDGMTGSEVWSTDGTPAGTRLVADLAPGVASSSPVGFVRIGQTAYFFAADANGNNVLWQTDGRSVAVASRAFADVPWITVAAGARLFMVCRHPSHVQTLQAFDAVTGVVTALARTTTPPGMPSRSMFAYGSSVVFDWYSTTHGYEPWISDGSVAGTRMIADLEPGPVGSSPQVLGLGPGNQVMLRGPVDELVATDGTAAGTVVLWTAVSSVGWFLRAADDRGFAIVRDLSGRRWDVVETDGTAGGTRLLRQDLAPLLVRGGRLFYGYDDGVSGNEPWAFAVWPTAVEVGSGCGAGPRTPTLHVTVPRLGAPLGFRGTGAPRGAAAAILFGAVADTPLRIAGGGGCVSELDLGSVAVLRWFAPVADTWTWSAGLPNVPALQGLTAATQVWFGPSTHPGGLESTNGVQLTFGR